MAATVSRLPLILSLIAIILGGGLVASAVTFQNTINSLNDKINSLNGRVDNVQAPKVQNLSVTLMMSEVVNASANPEDLAMLEYHHWNPSVLVVHLGDTVKLKVTNADDAIHSLEMVGFAIDTGNLSMDQSTTMTFTANKAGVFEFKCGVPYTPPNECVPDHASILGYLVVLAT